MLKCTINGKQYAVPEGASIIEAFKLAGESLAHYCWHPALSVAGVCRMCMVSIEGNPRLQIACNTMVTEGMVISNQSHAVKDSVKWVLDFHLINHPLDCPICDQAGECGLQDQYMMFGKYTPEMAMPKQRKRKVVSLGDRVVLDSERCILCSRCVRFTEEITKTHELGIFHRGDRSEIGTFNDRPLNNNYSLNTVDICPVGALTSKKFRFRQRVWFLKEKKSICPGCCTGCNIKVSYNSKGVFRVKPDCNPDVNGYWMCDEGRDLCEKTQSVDRLLKGMSKYGEEKWQEGPALKFAKQACDDLSALPSSSVALVLTAQHTCEEFEALIQSFKSKFKSKKVYYWVNRPEDFHKFDGLLLRGDRNPNTVGLLQILEREGFKSTWSELLSDLSSGATQGVIVAAPEFPSFYPDFSEKLYELSRAKVLTCLTSRPIKDRELLPGQRWLIPLKSFLEKEGTFINYRGVQQKLGTPLELVPDAMTLSDFARILSGDWLERQVEPLGSQNVINEFMKTPMRGL